MKIKINCPILGIDGIKPIPNPDSPGGRLDPPLPLTLKDVCINAVLSPMEGDDEKKKFTKWEIFKKLREAKEEVELTAEEIVIIKKGIGKFNPPLVLGQSFEMLEK